MKILDAVINTLIVLFVIGVVSIQIAELLMVLAR